MATLTIRNVPDDLYAELKARAARNRRSLNQEALSTIEAQVPARFGSSPVQSATFSDSEIGLIRQQAWERIRARRASMAPISISEDELEAMIAEGRP
jgi:plasmid stability protein